MHQGERIVSSTNSVEKTGYPKQNNEIGTLSYTILTHTKANNSERIKDLNVRPESNTPRRDYRRKSS